MDYIIRNYNKYHYSRLNYDEKNIYDYIVDNLARRNLNISISLGQADMAKIIEAISIDEPGLVHVDFTSETLYRDGIISFNELIVSEEEINQIDQVVNSIIRDVEGMDEYEKVLYVHDFFAKDCFYNYDTLNKCASGNIDNEALRSFKMLGVFLDKKAVCSGFAAAMNYVLSLLNIENFVIRCSYNDIEHAFNCVKINGVYTNIDISNDCKKEFISFERKKQIYYPFFRYTFGVTDELLMKFGYSSDEFYGCNDTTNDFLLNEGLVFYSWGELRRYIYKQCKMHKVLTIRYEGEFNFYKMGDLLRRTLYKHNINFDQKNCFSINGIIYCVYGGDLYEF